MADAQTAHLYGSHRLTKVDEAEGAFEHVAHNDIPSQHACNTHTHTIVQLQQCRHHNRYLLERARIPAAAGAVSLYIDFHLQIML